MPPAERRHPSALICLHRGEKTVSSTSVLPLTSPEATGEDVKEQEEEEEEVGGGGGGLERRVVELCVGG